MVWVTKGGFLLPNRFFADFFGVFLESVHFHVISDAMGFAPQRQMIRLKTPGW